MVFAVQIVTAARAALHDRMFAQGWHSVPVYIRALAGASGDARSIQRPVACARRAASIRHCTR
jgi:hypothetical protein